MRLTDVAREVKKRARHLVAANGQKPANTLEQDTQALGQALLTFYASASTSLVELSLSPPRFKTAASDKPVASPLARAQAATKHRVTNLRHETVSLGDLERHMVRHLDGKAGRAELVSRLAELTAQGELTVEENGQFVRDPARTRTLLEQAVDKQLPILARSALLRG